MVAPAIVTGNTVVVLAAERRPLPAVTLAEVLATSDLPGGVVNMLTGRIAEIAPWLAAHMDVNAIDLTGVDRPGAGRRPGGGRGGEPQAGAPAAGRPPTGRADPGLDRMTAFLETKTVWHPKGV